MTLFRAIALLIGGLLLLCLSLILYIGMSQDGARRLIDQAQPYLPGKLSVESIEGRLAGPLLVEGLCYQQQDGLKFCIEIFKFDWRPWSLLKGRLEITELLFSDSALSLPQGESSDQGSTPYQGVMLPLEITIERFSSRRFQLTTSPDGEPLVVDHLKFRATTEDQHLLISDLDFKGLSAELLVDGQVGLDRNLPLSLTLEWRYSLPEGAVIAGGGDITGDSERFHLQQKLQAPVASDLDIDLYDLFGNANWEALLAVDRVDLAAFVADFPAMLGGRIEAQGNLQQLSLNGDIQLDEPRLGKLSSELSASYRDHRVDITKLKLTNPNDLQLDAQGHYRLDDGVLAASLNWQQLTWPLTGESVSVASERGELDLKGSLEHYDYELTMAFDLPELPAAEIDADGQGTLQAITLQQMSLRQEDGLINGDGSFDWSDELNWRMELVAEDFNPGIFHPAFPGKLGFRLSSQGRLDNQQLQGELQLDALKGRLRDYPVQGEGAVTFAQNQATIKVLNLQSGPNRINASGSVGDQLGLDWSMEAPDLAGFWPGLSGELNGQGQLQGTLQTPQIVAQLSGQDIAYQSYALQGLAGELAFGMGQSQPVKLQLDTSGLALAGREWEALKVDLDGQVEAHQLKLALSGQEVPQLTLMIDAGLDQAGHWKGRLQQLRTESKELGEWQLEQAADFQLGEREQFLKPFCLVAGESRLCGEFAKHPSTDWRSQLQLEKFNLQRLEAWAPGGTKLKGLLGFEAELNANRAGEIGGRVDLKLAQAGLEFDYQDQRHEVDFSGSRLTARLDAEGGTAELEMPLKELGGINGKLRLPGLKLLELDLQQQRVSGQLKGGIENLAMVSSLLPQLQNSRGDFDINFEIQGVVAEPRLQGQAKLSGGAVDIAELGTELRDLELLIEAIEWDRLKVTGKVNSGDGALSINGTTILSAAEGFPSEYKITGKSWRAVDIPEAEVLISPDIQFKHQAAGTEVRGLIKVPYARLRPRELPKGAVSVSSDMVLKQSELADEPAQREAPFRAEVRLALGKRVSFDGFGLRGNFTGDLLIIDEPGRPVIGRGRLGIEEGVYKAYGQDLKIERGYALFADSPVDNPGINVRAVREVDDVVAGLRVSGTLKSPKLDLFSTPAMSESDVLSYILTGRPPGESSGQVGLAAALKASGASDLAAELGRRFGLEEFRLDTGSSLEEASFVAGTYLSPRLYVQYINELSSAESKLRMRYDLTDRWQLEAETGRTQAGDFFYTFEK
ncbi:MAG: translocation/assembly module TamB domain-containing protein [Candidatus Thiodiazotropha weberae]|uniref:translocation/assembly module TamB domain-containing protein n=1 Tax=Candidatus Thiodiazotropha endoloripes TaxID=1818881 RepID=UPI0009F20D28|nr:translocation/assembly module TamB domain-containing protein [Candidatus Thiodiazotropha endoloripes]MCG7898110.1 translocation/assembly module TamB domain-containing protein [Candidatus Thiodiazotropha weberae]